MLKLLRERLDDPLAQIRGIVSIANGKVQFKPTIEVAYRKKKKDGSYCKIESTIELAYGYCPFCGKPLYAEE